KTPALVYVCQRDGQCSGMGGRCIDSACAFPSTSCQSGLAFDASAGGRGGQCVSADVITGDDMSSAGGGDLGAADMSMAPDMATHCTWTATNNLPEASTRIWAIDASHLVAAGDNVSVSNTSGAGWSAKLLRDASNVGVHAHALRGFGSSVFIGCSGFNVFLMD